MSKWKKIKTKVEEVNSKLGLFNSNETNLTPTKLKRKIGKRNFYKDIRFYIVSSYIISLFVGFCIYFSQRKNYLFNYNIVQLDVITVAGYGMKSNYKMVQKEAILAKKISTNKNMKF